MARAGEESGSLPDALSVVGEQMERAEELTRKVKGAMIYPAIVVTAIIIVGILMLIYVVPTLTKTFTSLGVAVPLTTRIIVGISDVMTAHTALILGMLGVFVAGATGFVRSKRGGALIVTGALHLPVVGELVRETYAARTARTLSSLLASGVPVLHALSITKEVVRARPFARVIEEAEARVKKGEALSARLYGDPAAIPGFKLLDGRASYGIGLETGQLSAPTALKIAAMAIVMEQGASALPHGAVQASIVGAVIGIAFVAMIEWIKAVFRHAAQER